VTDETILLVEDDESVRTMMSEALRLAGWRLIVAENGEDALRAASEHAAPIDAVVADLNMPRMGGMTLLAKLRGWYPGLRFLLVSGFPTAPGIQQEAGKPTTMFLAKPFGPNDLVAALNALLDRPRPS
jgi:DNA-binding NtrC family response regulator